MGFGMSGFQIGRTWPSITYCGNMSRTRPLAVLGPVVPAGPLGRLEVSLEHPVAEGAPAGQHPAEEPAAQ